MKTRTMLNSMPTSRDMPAGNDAISDSTDRRANIVAQVRTYLSKARQIRDGASPIISGLSFADTTYVVVDLETTGLDNDDQITEIGALKVRGGQVLSTFQSMVNPLRPIPEIVMTLTGITNEDVEGAPTVDQVLPQFLTWIDDGEPAQVFVAQHVPFDRAFLLRACQQAGLKWRPLPYFDTLTLARILLPKPEVPSHCLGALADYFDAPVVEAHRALADSYTTLHVLDGLTHILEDMGVTSSDDIALLSTPREELGAY